MAGPITHIVLTSKVFPKYFSNKDIEPFLVGTSFPDIRYLGMIDRNKTHYGEMFLEEIQKENSDFLAGVKFHSLVDNVRENFVVSRNTYNYCPESKYITQAVKLVEDYYLYKRVRNWKNITVLFDRIYPEELNYSIEKEDILKWHKILQKYFGNPSKDTIRKFIIDMQFSDQVADEIADLFKNLIINKNILNIVDKLYENIENMLV